MLSYREALQRVLDSVAAGPVRLVPLDEAPGLVAAGDVLATDPVPPFDNSGMDGFAVRAADVAAATAEAPVRLRVLEDLPRAGVAGCAGGSGTALRIMTGAPMPAGADAVGRGHEVGGRAGRDPAPGARGRQRAPRGRGPRGRHACGRAGRRPAARGHRPAGRSRLRQRARLPAAAARDHHDRRPSWWTCHSLPGPGRIRRRQPARRARAGRGHSAALPVTFPRVPDRREEVAHALRQAAADADVIVTRAASRWASTTA